MALVGVVPQGRDDAADHRGLVAGEQPVLGEIYDAYAEFVYGVAFGVTGAAAVSEDIACEVFVGLWERPYDYDPARWSLAAWLVASAHRRAVAHVGRSGQSADRLGTEPEVHDAVTATLAGIAPELREVVELSYFRGLTYRQVAAKIGVCEEVVAKRVRDGLRAWAAAARGGARRGAPPADRGPEGTEVPT